MRVSKQSRARVTAAMVGPPPARLVARSCRPPRFRPTWTGRRPCRPRRPGPARGRSPGCRPPRYRDWPASIRSSTKLPCSSYHTEAALVGESLEAIVGQVTIFRPASTATALATSRILPPPRPTEMSAPGCRASCPTRARSAGWLRPETWLPPVPGRPRRGSPGRLCRQFPSRIHPTAATAGGLAA